MKININITEISNICVYHSIYSLVLELSDAEEWNALTDNELMNLKHLTDWNYQDFIVINDKEVISTDHLTGDVVAYEPIEEFIRQAIEAAKEED